MKNPYIARGPVLDARMFFGRTYDLNMIKDFLRGNQSFSIVGPQGIGKSSLMLQLMRPETRAALGITGETVYVYFECQELSRSGLHEILFLISSKINAALQQQGLEPEPALENLVSNPAWSSFESALRKLNQRDLRLVLILDDFERITTNPQVDVSFYNALRSAAGRLRLVFITCSSMPLVELTYLADYKTILSSPFFNIFAQSFLGLLSESEAKDLIRKPMESAGRIISSFLEDFIYQLAGRHPLALQIACFYTWDNPVDLQKIELLTSQELTPIFQEIWSFLSPREQDTLIFVVNDGLRILEEPVQRIALRDLTRKCLLVQSGGTYTFPSKAWADFIVSKLPVSQ